MTPTFAPDNFERIMGCTNAYLMSWLPGALPSAGLAIDTVNSVAIATFSEGALKLTWYPLPSARIAALEIPQLSVRLNYTGLSPEERYQVQKPFDLETLRGGG
jgi:hypothetical protein